tara:strand:- start:2153 stop:2818 length:666 start_codon:yes stop_codon:yes gene_type:complete
MWKSALFGIILATAIFCGFCVSIAFATDTVTTNTTVGNTVSSSSNTVSSSSNTVSSSSNTVNSTVTGTNTNSTVTGTNTNSTVIDKATTAATASSPSVIVNNSDVCVTGVSGSVQTSLFGVSGGSTIRDKNCEVLKLSRTLYGAGLKVAAVSLLCQDARVFDAMVSAGTPCPYDGKIGAKAKKLWLENPAEAPEGTKLRLAATKKTQDQNKEVFFDPLEDD